MIAIHYSICAGFFPFLLSSDNDPTTLIAVVILAIAGLLKLVNKLIDKLLDKKQSCSDTVKTEVHISREAVEINKNIRKIDSKVDDILDILNNSTILNERQKDEN